MTHAISRSKELLACAKTAQRLLPKSDDAPPQQPLALWHPSDAADPFLETGYENKSLSRIALEDGAIAIQAIERVVEQLDNLVRRRGHTNDPTEQIESCMTEFKTCMEELMSAAQTIRRIPADSKGNSFLVSLQASQAQRKKHYEIVASTIEQRGKALTEKFQSALSVRSDVLKLQAQRKKMLVSNLPNENTSNSSKTGHGMRRSGVSSNTSGIGLQNMGANQLNSPLFTMTGANRTVSNPISSLESHSQGKISQKSSSHLQPAIGVEEGINQTRSSAHSEPSTSSMYSSSLSQPSTLSSSIGMRRRGVKPQMSSSYYQVYSQQQNSYYNQPQMYEEDNNKVKSAHIIQQQVQQRRNARDTKNRLDNARQVESAIAELGQMFGRMASLVSQQQEIVDKIEDDVEASMVQVQAGSDEIQKVFEIVQSNRGLILKIFGLLIFFIIFFKIY